MVTTTTIDDDDDVIVHSTIVRVFMRGLIGWFT
jgi:hypothetical protein